MLAAGLVVLAAAAQADSPDAISQWTLQQESAFDAAFTQLDTGERLGLLCLPDQADCRWFVAPGWACEDGKPTLVRLEGEQGILRLGGQCAVTALGPVVLFDVDLAGFVRGSPAIEASLVSPAKERVTLRFGNVGAAKAIEQAREAQAARPAAPAN